MFRSKFAKRESSLQSICLINIILYSQNFSHAALLFILLRFQNSNYMNEFVIQSQLSEPICIGDKDQQL